MLPPRVAGLPDADVRALSGRQPVDTDSDDWTLIVHSFRSPAEADASAARYRDAGYRVGIVDSADGRWHRVVIGQFGSRADALRLRDRLPPQAPADTWAQSLRLL